MFFLVVFFKGKGASHLLQIVKPYEWNWHPYGQYNWNYSYLLIFNLPVFVKCPWELLKALLYTYIISIEYIILQLLTRENKHFMW